MRAGSGGQVGGVGGQASAVGAAASRPAARAATARSGGFRVPSPQGSAAPPTAPAATMGADSLLALQEASGGAVPRAAAQEHPALSHAEVILDDLSALQLGLLGNGSATDRAAVLQRLAAGRVALGAVRADPALAEILDGLALRAEIELVRRGWREDGEGR